jgi:microcystin-dependent protein|nr:MAG TPA: baseplate wedge protein [Caudoviricetes sp.]
MPGTLDFSKIWGSNAPQTYTFTDENYLSGWTFVGQSPPSRYMWDAWMNNADLKMQWLYNNAFSESSLGGFLFWRLPSTAYFVGDLRQLQNGPLDVYLKCTTAGMSSEESITDLPEEKNVGDSWEDGSVTWEIMQFASSDSTSESISAHNNDRSAHKDYVGATASTAGQRGMLPAAPAGAQDKVFNGGGKWVYAALNILQRNKAYQVGDYAYSPTLPSWAYLECVTAGTTAATEPSLPSTINSVVTDGTASFKLYHVALQSQPVGTVRDFTVDFDPNTKWGGTWSKMAAGRVLVAAGAYSETGFSHTYTLGETGGEAKHQLTTDELPSHKHTISSTGAHTHYVAWKGTGAQYGTLSSGNYLATACDEHGDWSQNYNLSGQNNAANSGKTSSTGAHTHTIANAGNDNSHENRMPFETVARWKRTA